MPSESMPAAAGMQAMHASECNDDELMAVLMSREVNGKHKFLCGHDERHWFVAAVPEAAAVSTVATAMEALKPFDVRRLQDRLAVKPRKRNRRRNEAFVRQGEWFFVPVASSFQPKKSLILTNEPLRRGAGKPQARL